MSKFNVRGYNPDVLSCLANLSNDEVFTSPDLANQVLDMLPEEIFKNPDTTFLDPVCKTGVFLREIAKRLTTGLSDKIPNLQDRLNHICTKQLFGIAITELTSLLTRRSIYCSKYANSKWSICSEFNSTEGNIAYHKTQHVWKDDKCVYCNAAKSMYLRSDTMEAHAYEFIHTMKPEEIFNVKFDVIIGNPPYQLSTGGNRAQATPLYDKFVEQAKKLNPHYLIMIIPSRWFSGGMGLGNFRNTMLNDYRISKLVDYQNSKDCFEGVDIAGGVCYFLWEGDRSQGLCEVVNVSSDQRNSMIRALNEFGGIFIRNNNAISIINKTKAKTSEWLTDMVYSLDVFGFPTYERGRQKSEAGDIKIVHSQGIGYIARSNVKKNPDLVDYWKVIIARVVPCNGEVGIDPSKGYNAITTPRIIPPGVAFTFTYLLLGAFNNQIEAQNYQKYLISKYARFMLRLTYSSMNIAKSNFAFVPKMDFSKVWLDEDLYRYFELSGEEINLIERTMRPMVVNDGGQNA